MRMKEREASRINSRLLVLATKTVVVLLIRLWESGAEQVLWKKIKNSTLNILNLR